MNDIDFDELDRAVNSLSSGASPTPVQQPAVTSSNPPVVPQPVNSAPTPAPTASSGRFMDVVHPSSDMRPVSIPQRQADPTSRPIVTPPSATIAPPQPVAPNPVTIPKPDTSGAPSPFLADTKVEKRPLGAFNDQTSTNLGNDKQDKNSPEARKKDLTPLPPELNEELLSVEIGEDTSTTAEPQPQPSEPETPIAQEQPAPGGSIMQQYAEKAADPAKDDSVKSVFDTDSYQKPAKDKSKKSGWMVVLWILLLIVLGAAAGAAIYYYVLPIL